MSSRVCALPGRALVQRGGKWEESTLDKKHCGKMVGMMDVGRRGNTHYVIVVGGKKLAVHRSKAHPEKVVLRRKRK